MEKGVINSIKIEGVKGEGDYNLSTKEWSVSSSSAAASYNVPISAGLTVGTETVNLAPNATLMMIPQTLGDDAKVTIKFTPTGKSETKASFSLGGTTWEPGRHITYVLSTTKLLNLNMGTIAYPDGWESVNDNAVHKIKSSYTNGDAIGMYVVDKYNKVIEANLKFTYNDNDSKWTVEPGKEFKGSPQYNYFVYYPYQEGGLPGAPAKNASNIDVTSAEKFFADAIKEWGKKFDTSSGQTIDQSDIEKMNSFDLQIGKADDLGKSGTTINFRSMKHAMGLAEIVLGEKKVDHIYKTQPFGKAGVYTWDDKIVVYASNKIKGYKPFNIANHKYVTIVRPKGFAGPTKLETEESDVDGWKASLSFSPSGNQVQTLEAENKRADADMSKAIEYPIDLGYIFYNDGSISKDLTGQTITSDHCPVGIIVYLAKNNDGNDKWAETNTAGSGIGGHGLVMSLKNAGSTKSDSRNDFMQNYQWWKSASGNQTGLQSTNFSDYLNSQTTELGSGYLVSKKIGTDSPAVDAAITYKPSYNSFTAISLTENAQSKTTGWFFSSVGQFIAMLDATNGGINKSTLGWNVSFSNLNNDTNVTNKINDYLWKAAGAKDINEASANYTYFGYETYNQFWCTGELNAYNAVSVCCVLRGKGTVYFTYPKHTYGNAKTYALSIRPFLAF